MSQTSNSTPNMNISSKLSSDKVDNNKINSTTAERVPKNAASDELGGVRKKFMVDHPSQKTQVSSIVPKSSDPPKFVSAATMASSTRINVQTIPELSDDELLAMTIEFEKKYPQ